MVFGINKKRESWSSRPLSMILPENVKLFSKKSRGMIEKASQDHSGKAIESQRNHAGSSSSAIAESTSSHSSGNSSVNRAFPETSNHEKAQKKDVNKTDAYSKSYDRHNLNSHNPIPEETEQDLGSPSQSFAETSSSSIAQNDKAPFLTLDLDDNESSLQDLTDHLSELDVHTPLPPKIPPVAPARAAKSKRDSVLILPAADMEKLRSLGESQTDSSVQNVNASTTPETTSPIGEKQWNGSSDTLLLSQMRAANRAATELGAEEPVSGEEHLPEDHFDKATGELPTDKEESSATKSLETPELDSERHDSSSGESAGTAVSDKSPESEESNHTTTNIPAAEKENAYLLNPSVKVMINRGVYIFDPSDRQDCLRSLKLSDDESFNPFAFE